MVVVSPPRVAAELIATAASCGVWSIDMPCHPIVTIVGRRTAAASHGISPTTPAPVESLLAFKSYAARR